MTLSKARLAVIVLVAALAGWFLNDAVSPPAKRRPILNLIRNWWWVPLILDEPQACHTHDHAEPPPSTGLDGFPIVDHRRAF